MTTADDPDVLDGEFREVPAARRRSRSRAARRDAAAEGRIGLQHLTFFRGYLEGVDLAKLADQYLEFDRAPPRDSAGRSRHDACGRRPGAGHSVAGDFAAEQDSDGFYAEKELLDLFAARHASAHCARGRWRRSRT
ncbi:hypothetical protein [Burkholderia latens]|uniref:hypothetical protein n=1 Tax=Burkholderia latens TaxID=488446 RepID=UPI001FD73EBC|nr:hypothetical protein [Burkholderia latens]